MLLVATGIVLWVDWSVPLEPTVHQKVQKDQTRESIVRTRVHQFAPDSRQDPRMRVNLNRATLDELRSLPGIGPVLAQRILVLRNQVGSFQSPEDLLAVKGVGAKRLARLIPHLQFDQAEKVSFRMSPQPTSGHTRTPIS